MGCIKEPDGIDFVIAPSENAEEDIRYISAYIQQKKKLQASRTLSIKRPKPKRKVEH